MKPNLRAVDNDHPHNLDIARQRIAEWRSNVKHRQARAIDPDYDFSNAPRAARQVIYDMTVKYSAQHSWWARLRGR